MLFHNVIRGVHWEEKQNVDIVSRAFISCYLAFIIPVLENLPKQAVCVASPTVKTKAFLWLSLFGIITQLHLIHIFTRHTMLAFP